MALPGIEDKSTFPLLLESGYERPNRLGVQSLFLLSVATIWLNFQLFVVLKTCHPRPAPLSSLFLFIVYFEYSSTTSDSLVRRGNLSLSGAELNLPSIFLVFTSIQSGCFGLFSCTDNESCIRTWLFDASLTLIIS